MKKQILLLVGIFCFLFSNAQPWTLVGLQNDIILSIAIHPNNSNVIITQGSYYTKKSTNGGISWDTCMTSAVFNNIYYSPYGCDTVFATMNVGGSFSDGVYKSIDGGQSFNMVRLIGHCNGLAFPGYPTGSIIAGSNSEGVALNYYFGYYSWYYINDDSLANQNVLSVAAVNPYNMDSGQVFIAGTKGGIFYFDYDVLGPWHSTNIRTNAYVKSISKFQNGQCLFAAIDKYNGNAGIYKSTDYGKTWQLSLLWDSMSCVLVNQKNTNTVFAGNQKHGVKVSYNGGLSWKALNNGLQDSAIICLAQSPNDTSRLYAGTYHGLYRIDFPASIAEEQQKINIIKVFPNPAATIIYLPIAVSHSQVSIYNALGKLVYQNFDANGINKINVSQFEQGIYFGTVDDGKSKYVFRFVKE